MKLSEKVLAALDRIGQEDEDLRRQLFDNLCNVLHGKAMNMKCDVGAIAKEHVIGYQAGHKQARHDIAGEILELMHKFITSKLDS